MAARLICLLMFCCTVVLPGGGFCESPPPIHVEADRMESDQSSSAVQFSGKVLAKQGDLSIRADEMTVRYKNGDATAQGIDKLEARGNIEIARQNWVATGNRLEYFAGERRVLLLGSAKVWQENNTVSGERIELYLDTGKSVVEKSGAGERVKAFFYPGSRPAVKK